MQTQKRPRVAVSSRVRRYLVDLVREEKVPVERVIEAGIGYYLQLEEDEKKKFLINYTPGVTCLSDEDEFFLKNVDQVPLSVIAAWVTAQLD